MTPLEAAEAARSNPAAFLALALGRPISPLQRDLISHALQHHSWYAELPRGHAKTSTLSYLIAWWLGVRPETRVKVVSQNDEAAASTTRFLRDIIRSPTFRAVFPDVSLKTSEDTVTAWSVAAAGVPSRRDASVQGSGVFGRTGGRADLIWFDDICDLRNSVLQPALRAQVKEAVANIWMPMLDPSSAHTPRVWRSATPFHTDDITADWRRRHESDASLLRRPCVGAKSPWSEVFTAAVLDEKKAEMGAMAYARAYELIPLSSDLLVFRPEWLGYYRSEALPINTRTIAAIDWGYGKRAQEREDPDFSVCIIGEIDAQKNLYLTDILRVRESFPTFARMAADLLNRRSVSVVCAEANGPQKGIFDQFAAMTSQPMLSVDRVNDKYIRSVAAQPFVQAGKLMFPTSADGRVISSFQPVVDEMLSFPAGSHDDTVDVIVDLCGEAVRGSLSSSDRRVRRFEKPDAITAMFGSSKSKRPFFA
jgi:predicted phage terminase large subunit-like protein